MITNFRINQSFYADLNSKGNLRPRRKKSGSPDTLFYCPTHKFVWYSHTVAVTKNATVLRCMITYTRAIMPYYGKPHKPCMVCNGRKVIIFTDPSGS